MLLIGLFMSLAARADEALISVTGTASKSVDPNIVNVQVEIWSRQTQAKAAQDAVAKEYVRVKSLVERFKIKKEHFQSQSYNLNPEMDYNAKGGARPVAYRASHTVYITHNKVEEAGQLIDALSTASKLDMGGVAIQNIAWDYDKRSQVELGLLGEAVKDARTQADELAKASNAKIKRPFRLTYSGSFEPPPQPAMMRKTMMAEMADSTPTEVSGGPVKIRVQVSAEYEIQ